MSSLTPWRTLWRHLGDWVLLKKLETSKLIDMLATKYEMGWFCSVLKFCGLLKDFLTTSIGVAKEMNFLLRDMKRACIIDHWLVGQTSDSQLELVSQTGNNSYKRKY